MRDSFWCVVKIGDDVWNGILVGYCVEVDELWEVKERSVGVVENMFDDVDVGGVERVGGMVV